MNRFLTFLLIVLASAFAATGANAITPKDLVGTWTLVSADAFGPNPKGTLMFDSKGHMAWMLMRADLPKYASNNRGEGAPEEYKATVQGSICQYGTYKLSGADLLVHIDASTFANWNGVDQKRTNLTLSGDRLTWTQATPSAGGPPAVVVWQRAR